MVQPRTDAAICKKRVTNEVGPSWRLFAALVVISVCVGCNVNNHAFTTEGTMPEKDSIPPVHAALEVGDYARAKEILLADPSQAHAILSPDFPDQPLHVTSKVELVPLLLRCGADIHARGDRGMQPLHCAARYLRTDIVALLLDHGADVNAKDELKWTPLIWACWGGEGDPEPTAALLLERGAELDLLSALVLEKLDVVRAMLWDDPKSVQNSPASEDLLVGLERLLRETIRKHCPHPDRSDRRTLDAIVDQHLDVFHLLHVSGAPIPNSYLDALVTIPHSGALVDWLLSTGFRPTESHLKSTTFLEQQVRANNNPFAEDILRVLHKYNIPTRHEGVITEMAIKDLRAHLRSTDPLRQAVAAMQIEHVWGAMARPILPDLLAAARSADPRARSDLRRAIRAVDPDTAAKEGF